MAKNQQRWATFEGFACSRNGNALRNRVFGMARYYLNGHLAKIDSNWHSVDFRYDEPYAPQKLLELPLTDENACRMEFDYRPSSVTLVGPKVGHMSLDNVIFDMIPEPLVALIRMFDVFKPWHKTVYNPKHVIELIEGKTIIEFENCTSGVVSNVRGDEFDVEDIGCWIELHDDQKHYTREKLLAEFEINGFLGQAVDVSYIPYLPVDGHLMDTPEAIREVRRIASEKQQAENEARETQRQADEAAAYAALSPEERTEVDAQRELETQQAELIRGLFPILPHL